jgi:hypothetical protein
MQMALYESILASPHRTLNGEEADFFFVPVLDACIITRADDAPHLSMKVHFLQLLHMLHTLMRVYIENIYDYIYSLYFYVYVTFFFPSIGTCELDSLCACTCMFVCVHTCVFLHTYGFLVDLLRQTITNDG